MKKELLIAFLAIVMCFTLVGCGKTENHESSNNNKEEQIETQQEEEQKEETTNKKIYVFDLEQIKPNMGGQEFNNDDEVEHAVQGKIIVRHYGEFLGRPTSSDEVTAYAVKVFNYCKSISSDGKVYQSVARFRNPNNTEIKEVNSVKEAEKISNTYTWSIKSDGHWYVITIIVDKYQAKYAIGVGLSQLSSY